MAAQLGMNLYEAQKQRILQINQLDEIKQDALQRMMLIQNQQKTWHDKFIKQKKFHTGDQALLFNSRFKNFKGKLTTRWMGPYEVVTTFDNGSIKIKTIDGSEISFVVNRHRLRLYHQPTSKQDFIQNVLQQNEMELVEGEIIPPPPAP